MGQAASVAGGSPSRRRRNRRRSISRPQKTASSVKRIRRPSSIATTQLKGWFSTHAGLDKKLHALELEEVSAEFNVPDEGHSVEFSDMRDRHFKWKRALTTKKRQVRRSRSVPVGL